MVDLARTGRLVDPSSKIEGTGDPNKDLVAVDNATATAKKPAEAPAVDPRFAGKSADQLIDMYRNLESHAGRLASEKGNLERNLTTVLEEKRIRDLRAGGGSPATEAPEAPTLDAAELLQSPAEAVTRFVKAIVAPEIAKRDARIAQLESGNVRSNFQRNHPDSQEIVQTPEFAAFVRETPLRMQLAANASQGNDAAADALLTEFKAQKKVSPAKATEKGIEEAKGVTLEQPNANAGRSSSEGKTYRRADIIALKMNNPERYEALGPEILKAYQEGRVI